MMHTSHSILLGGLGQLWQLNWSGRWHVWGIEDVNAGFGVEICEKETTWKT